MRDTRAVARPVKTPPPRVPVPEDVAKVKPPVRERLRLAYLALQERGAKVTVQALRREAACDYASAAPVLRAQRDGRMPPLHQPWDEAASPPPPRQAPQSEGVEDDGEEQPPSPTDHPQELARKAEFSKARQLWWRAKIDRLKALREEGVLVSREEVISEHAQMIARARARLLALPGAVASAMAAESDPRRIEAYLDTQLRLALEDLAGELAV